MVTMLLVVLDDWTERVHVVCLWRWGRASVVQWMGGWMVVCGGGVFGTFGTDGSDGWMDGKRASCGGSKVVRWSSVIQVVCFFFIFFR